MAEVVSFSKPFTGDAYSFIDDAVSFIRENVKPDDRFIIPVSGGVDSRITYRLFSKAIDPTKLYPFHMDTIFMRTMGGIEEPKLVAKSFKGAPNFEVVNAREHFRKNTFHIDDDEEKRKQFQATYNDEITKLMEKRGIKKGSDGTIGPDRAETLGGEYKGVKFGKLKMQHNVGNDPFELKIEPLATLSKDEVRKVGLALGLSENEVCRMEYPGPGLSIRIPGSIDDEKLLTEKRANDIVERGIEKHFSRIHGKPFLYDYKTGERIPFQYFAATIDPDINEYSSMTEEVNEYVNSLLAKNSAECSILETKATGMENVGGIFKRTCRPIMVLKTERPLDSIVLRHIGEVVPEEFPISRVLHEIKSGGKGQHIVSIRAGKCKNAMTWEPVFIDYGSMARKIIRECNVSKVCVDGTPKPPGTIEYE